MAHLSDESIYKLTFERGALDIDETGHLAACAACRTRVAESSDLAQALYVARLSEPTIEQQRQLLSLGRLVETKHAGRRLIDWVRASLAMDTRAALSAGGVRGVDATYRLLYAAQSFDVELMVEQTHGTNTIMGVLLPLAAGETQETALVQLEADGHTMFEEETTSGGRFIFDSVPSGNYRMWITNADSADVVIDNLEIS